ncbi:hypothetical protein FE697_018990 [Mumia zhuanghuii]|uniref:Uncharacterized protein n=1 Tax=Mumia zhuanghuii TaxID=2585211 RepID=A0A5Q6RQ26_9ACTN|nr:hypothetical protein FE697_018990 [Mumia zhuanghuii]
MTVLGLSGCDDEAQFAPSLPSAAGYRDDGGALRIWTGTPCEGVTRVALTFAGPGDERARLVLRAPSPGVTVEHLDPAAPDAAFEPEESLPDGYDWRTADTISLVIDGAEPAWGSVVGVDQVVVESPDHPEDSFLFDDLGWKDPTAVDAENGTSFLTVCTPDPEQ